jgi:hypothetical protein
MKDLFIPQFEEKKRVVEKSSIMFVFFFFSIATIWIAKIGGPQKN